MKLPKNIAPSFPLVICEECPKCSPEIEMLYITTDICGGEYEHYELKCKNEEGCIYAYEKGVKKNG